MKALYFHGGPGFNSNPERHLRRAPFAAEGWDVRFFDEPSARRPGGPEYADTEAFEKLLGAAEVFFLQNYEGEPLVLIAHSFGAHAVCRLALRHPEKIAMAVFVSPALAVAEADRGLFNVIMLDYLARGDARHERLATVLARYRGTFDASAAEGYDLLVQNPRLFGYYWFNHARMAEFLPHYAELGYEIDFEGFRRVRRVFAEIALADSPVPAVALFGEKDVCISEEAEIMKLKSRFSDLTIHRFSHSAHYPHVEETDLFLNVLNSAARASRGPFRSVSAGAVREQNI